MNDIRQDRLIFKIFPIFTHPYIAIMRLDRPIGYMLLFYPISFSIFAFSDLNFEMIHLLFIFFIGSVSMRSAGCIINDLLDQDIDNKVERTKTRPLVSKTLSKRNSFFCLLILFLIGFMVLIQLNLPSIILSLAIVPLIFLYPLAKRFFLLPQFILAFTYNWGCLIGWSSLNSPSDFESFHYSIADGVSSGAMPIIWPWDGAKEIYSEGWVINDTQDAANVILNSEIDENILDENRDLIRSRYGLDFIFKELEKRM